MSCFKKIIVLFVLVTLTSQANAQLNNYFYLNWDINKPISNTDWLGSTSSAGGKIGYRFFPFENSERISLGVDYSWTTLAEYAPKETFYNSTGAITTDYFKYVYNHGVVVSGQYNFDIGSDLFFPYAGLGLGANWNKYNLFYNIYTEEEKKVGFLARPEAGMLARFGTTRSMGAMFAVHLDYSTNKSDDYGYSNFSTVGFQLGIILMNRY